MAELPGGLHGAYTRAELRRILTTYALRTALEDRRLSVFARNVLIDRSRAADFRTRAAASLLLAGPSAVLSGHSALTLYGCTGGDRAAIHVTVPYFRNLERRPGLVIHRGSVDAQDITELDELRTVVLDVAAAEVLCRSDRRTAIACADQALALVPDSERAEFRASVADRIRSRPDPRGRRQGLCLLELASGLTESPMESWLLLAVADGGLPVPVPQFVINDLAGRAIYRLDFAWETLRIGLEYDGYEAHEHRRDRDAARDEDLHRRGWSIIRADLGDLKEPSGLLARIRREFRSRGFGG